MALASFTPPSDIPGISTIALLRTFSSTPFFGACARKRQAPTFNQNNPPSEISRLFRELPVKRFAMFAGLFQILGRWISVLRGLDDKPVFEGERLVLF